MESNSGRFPLDLLSFCLDMSSENITEENTSKLPSTAENEQPANSALTAITARQANNQEFPGTSREAPTPSPSTEERTLQELGQHSEVRFLSAPEAKKEFQPSAPEVTHYSAHASFLLLFVESGTRKFRCLSVECLFVESGTNDVICQFCTVKGMVVESEILKALCCALSK